MKREKDDMEAKFGLEKDKLEETHRLKALECEHKLSTLIKEHEQTVNELQLEKIRFEEKHVLEYEHKLAALKMEIQYKGTSDNY